MSIINAETFQAAAEQPEHGIWTEGTVEVTLRGETRRVNAYMDKDGSITAFGMTGRYQTGTKAWPASVRRVIDPTNGKAWDRIHFGRDDRAAKFCKTSALHFA